MFQKKAISRDIYSNFLYKKEVNMKITTHQLATPNDLGQQACEAIAVLINALVANAFALFVKTKSYHWHLSGKHYYHYHLLFDKQAEQIFKVIDILAERVRKLGFATIHSVDQIKQLQNISDDNDIFIEADEMLRRLMKDNKSYIASLRAAHKVCERYEDVATTSLLENFIDEAEERVWFLYESQI